MFLKDGDGKWEVVLNNPLDECLVGVFLFAVVCKSECQGLRRCFCHFGSLVVKLENAREVLIVALKKGGWGGSWLYLSDVEVWLGWVGVVLR